MSNRGWNPKPLLGLIVLCFLTGCEIIENIDPAPAPRGSTAFPPMSTPAPDIDGDNISDAVEWRLIEKFKPVLIFDENEPLDVANETVTLYQVHPVIKGRQEGYLITLVILYALDYGMTDFDLDGWDHITCGPIFGDALAYLASQLDTDGHCGDSEALRIFVADYGDTWKIESLVMKRHHDDWKEYPESAFSFERDEETGLRTHPIIYVSESKHAMYASSDECEGYSVEIYDFGLSCEVKFEDCDGGVKLTLHTPPAHNVGEHGRHAFETLDEVSRLFPGESVWRDTPFCGGYTWESCEEFAGMFDKTCAGSLLGKWFPEQ